MALKKRIAKSQTVAFKVTAPDAVDVVVIFSGEQSEEVYEQFAYPPREVESDETPFTDLIEESTGVFTGTLSEDATRSATTDILVADVKIWNAAGDTRIKRWRFLELADTKVKTVEPNPAS